LMEEMGWEDRHRAYAALRAVLQALRDHLSVDDAAALGAQLPMLVRGIYYEGWHPAHKPIHERGMAGFLDHVAAAFRGAPLRDPGEVARAVIALLARHVSRGEVAGIKHVLPAELRHLWP